MVSLSDEVSGGSCKTVCSERRSVECGMCVKGESFCCCFDSSVVRSWRECGSDVARMMWLGCGSDVARMWLVTRMWLRCGSGREPGCGRTCMVSSHCTTAREYPVEVTVLL